MKTDFTLAQATIEYDHNKIHEGQLFSVGDIAVSIAAGASLYYLLTTGSKSLHLRPARISSSSDSLKYEIFQGTNYSGGSAVAVTNRNLNSRAKLLSSLTKSPTGTTEGTRILGDYLPGSVGVGQSRSGDASTEQNELIVPPNTTLLVKFSNGSSGANLVTFSYNLYEV